MRQRADEAELPITVCGEAGGRPLEAITLAALGYRKLSMQAARVAPIKLLIRSIDMSVLAPRVQGLLDSSEPSIRNALLSVANELGLKI
jgi:phosphotransferase system enzyme I (PtsP)